MSAISVIVPAYNAERYLAEALDSVLGQTQAPEEIIVVNDGSTDGTEDIARSFGRSVCLLSTPHGGAGAARNAGVESAQGEFVSFLDADDLWMPEKLSLQREALRARPNVHMVFGYVRQFISPELDEAVRSRIECPAGSMPGFHAGTMFIRRTTFQGVGPFNTGLKVGEFIDWYLRAVEAGLQSIMLPDVVMSRRLHGTNLVLRERTALPEYASILKASLDRRRMAQKRM
jgi:glycosyltransferase involved in cell wall biosynthesis